MATILTKKKDTTGAPATGDLTNSSGGAELAVNTADKRLYTKNSSNAVVEIGTNPGTAVTFVAGTASDPAITTTGDTNTGIFFPAADTIAFAEGGAEAMRIDSGGNLGLGVTPSAWGAGVLNKAFQNSSYFSIAPYNGLPLNFLTNNAYNDGTNWKYLTSNPATQQTFDQTGGIAFSGAASGTAGNNVTFAERMRIDSSGNVRIGEVVSGTSTATPTYLTLGSTFASTAGDVAKTKLRVFEDNGGAIYGFGVSSSLLETHVPSGASMAWYANNNVRMVIDSSGNLLVGATSFTNTNFASGSVYVNNNVFVGNSSGTAGYNCRLDGFGDEFFVVWNDGTSDNNSIKYAYGGTAWVNTSDENLKDIIEPITNAAEKVSSLRAVIGKYKTEEEGVRHPFIIAQDVQAVLPEAVYVSKGRKENEPDTLGVGYTDVIPLLVAAIKELKAELDAAKERIAALENA